MKKRLLALFVALLLVGCAAPTPSSDDAYVSFIDDSGQCVSLEEQPRRVAVLFSSFADIWQLAGGEVAVTVGEAVERGIVPDGVLLVDAGAGKTVNTELLLAYQPDFVIGSADIAAHVECAALLRGAGTPAALFRLECFDDYLRVLRVMTDVTGNTAAYEQYGEAQKTNVDALLAASRGGEGKTVLFLRAGSSARSTKAKTSEQHFAAAMLCELGARNLADEAPVLVDGLAMEVIMAANPDLILITTMGDEDAARANMDAMLQKSTWQTLDAVQNGRVRYLDKELFQYKPNARWYEAYSVLSELLDE